MIEVVISCLFGLIGLGLPVLLYMIYNKVQKIEQLLKKE